MTYFLNRPQINILFIFLLYNLGQLIDGPAPLSGSVFWNVTSLLQPGLYAIINTEDGKSYFGESNLLAKRISAHLYFLQRSEDDNKKLQDAYNQAPDKSVFQFFVLECGPQWADKDVRLAKEKEYIASSEGKCYNDTGEEPQLNKGKIRPLMADGRFFKSTRAASEVLKMGRTGIKRKLANPKETEWYYLTDQEEPFGSSPVFAKRDGGPSVCFSSLKACVEAGGFATNLQNLQRKIKRNEDGFRYAHFDPTTGKHLRTPYTLKDGEMLYTSEYPHCPPYLSSSSSSLPINSVSELSVGVTLPVADKND